MEKAVVLKDLELNLITAKLTLERILQQLEKGIQLNDELKEAIKNCVDIEEQGDIKEQIANYIKEQIEDLKRCIKQIENLI